MALIVTPGASNAEAYLDVATADAMAAADIGAFASKWAAAVTGAPANDPNRLRKEAALRRASQDVDEIVRAVPAVAVLGQALLFPRSIDWSSGSWIIPPGITRAVYRQAIYVFSTADTTDRAKTRAARGLSNFTEPNVSGTIAAPAPRFDPSLEGILQPFTVGATVGWIQLS